MPSGSEATAGSEEREFEPIRRDPSGNVEAPDGYVDYAGQVIVRTRYATLQRFKKSGWDSRRGHPLPYILGSTYCTGEEVEKEDGEPMNPELGPTQFSVKYVETGETEFYEVVDDGE